MTENEQYDPPDANDFNRQIIEEFRANGGQVGGMFAGQPMLLLTTTGAKSGQQRTSPLGFIIDNGRLVVMASNAGAPTNPAWLHNLRATPEVTVEVGTETFPARATIAEGAERQRLYDQLVTLMPAFGAYQDMTTRQIPMVVLEREA